MAGKSVVLVNGSGVRVRVPESKAEGLRASGFKRPGGRPPKAKQSEKQD